MSETAASAPLVFLDTETTGLDPDKHEVWEVGLIVRDEGGDKEYHWFAQVDLKAAEPIALNVGGFFDRYDASTAIHPSQLAEELGHIIPARAHLVGNVVSFDEERLRRLLQREGVKPPWHYHLVDVESMIAGKLGLAPPWESDDLSAAIGVAVTEDDRHTALGDARWAMHLYDAMVKR